jgi:hypothetical protein
MAFDRLDRYLIIPEGGGAPVAHTRATTWASTLDDRYGLERWSRRTVAPGRPRRGGHAIGGTIGRRLRASGPLRCECCSCPLTRGDRLVEVTFLGGLERLHVCAVCAGVP